MRRGGFDGDTAINSVSGAQKDCDRCTLLRLKEFARVTGVLVNGVEVEITSCGISMAIKAKIHSYILHFIDIVLFCLK